MKETTDNKLRQLEEIIKAQNPGMLFIRTLGSILTPDEPIPVSLEEVSLALKSKDLNVVGFDQNGELIIYTITKNKRGGNSYSWTNTNKFVELGKRLDKQPEETINWLFDFFTKNDKETKLNEQTN